MDVPAAERAGRGREMTLAAAGTPATVTPAQLRAEQLRLLYNNLPLGAAAGLFNAGLLVLVQRNVVAPLVLIVWFGLIALLTAGRLGLFLAFRRARPGHDRVSRWWFWYAAGAAVTGAIWGSAGVFLLSDDLAHQMFVIFVLAGMTAGAVVTFYADMWVAYLFIVPTLLPSIVRMLRDPMEMSGAMAMMVILFLAVILIIARRTHLVTVTSLSLRFANNDLIDNLAAEKREIENLNQELRREISERIRSEQSLRDSEGRTRAIVDNVLDGIITMDETGRLESVNSAAAKIFDCAPDELVGRHIRELLLPDDRDAYESMLRQQTTGTRGRMLGFGLEATGLRCGDRSFPMELGVSAVTLGDRRMFVAIVRDITERKQVERMKSQFVAAVSHELRTPLTALIGSLGLLAEGVAGELPERGRSLVAIARGNVERLARLVADILDFDEIQSGRVLLRLKPVDLVVLVEQAAESKRAAAGGRGVALDFRPGLRVATVRADRERLLHVIDHLLSNAIKFSPSGTSVTVTLEQLDAAVRVAVHDLGPGIPEEFRPRVFEAFAQADFSDASHPGGAGLGLSIARAIVELHGGRIGFEPSAGRGTSFYFELPMLLDPAAAGAAH